MTDKATDPKRLQNDLARYVVSPDVLRDLMPADQSDVAEDAEFGSGAANARLSQLGQPAPSARVIIELNPDYRDGLLAARAYVAFLLGGMNLGDRTPDTARGGRYYLFAELTLDEIALLLERPQSADPTAAVPGPIIKIWRDEPIKALIHRSIRTVKADACLTAFGADGRDVVIAITDSGIEDSHPHFQEYGNLTNLPPGVSHRDFTGGSAPTVDVYGHGTHVAGIVAGRTDAAKTPIVRISEVRDERDVVTTTASLMPADTVLRGVAPKAKLVSLKVLDGAGKGYASALIEALEHIAEVNDFGRRIKIHCVNLSLGYPFDAAWHAAGHSPLCAVVNRLSRSGVVMVAAAGNDGSMLMQTEGRTNRQRVGVDQSINDPGNAEEAITVGATHAEAPHRYGVSYFSSRGPTADGRVKPDMVAPGERILSCAAAAGGTLAAALKNSPGSLVGGAAYFREESGTSMAAPHVAGAVAAFLSIRTEFVGRPEDVKRTFVSSCTDLRRKADFQGSGLLDLMRAIQSI